MTPTRKKRLFAVLALLAGVSVAVALALQAFNDNLLFFYSPTQVAEGEAPENARFRIGGLVVPGSVKREPGKLAVQFDLTDNANEMTVYYEKILPDLFREGQGIIARGRLNEAGILVADEVLAKHDENYMPPEIAEALEKAGHKPKDKSLVVDQ
jgi:cytochrome c-type biogenesis protein CcmE